MSETTGDLIVKAETVGDPVKVPDRWGRKTPEWKITVVFTLADGREVVTSQRDRTRKGVTDVSIFTRWQVHAMFNDAGEYSGYRTTIGIGSMV